MNPLEIGICSWSIDRDHPVNALAMAKSRFGLGVVHLGYLSAESLEQADASTIRAAASAADIEISGVLVGFEGEDRSSIASVNRTRGFVSDGEVGRRSAIMATAAGLAAELGVAHLTAHLGAIPADIRDPLYEALLPRVRAVADALAGQGLTLLAETGQEPADVLDAFIERLDRPNVAVNLDPGNFVLYGNGDPVKSASVLRHRIRHVHVKDAVPSARPGAEWGTPRPLGGGDADIPRVISKLRAWGYGGPLVIEHPPGDEGGVHQSVEYLRSLIGCG